jgi:hypothetical protein
LACKWKGIPLIKYLSQKNLKRDQEKAQDLLGWSKGLSMALALKRANTQIWKICCCF